VRAALLLLLLALPTAAQEVDEEELAALVRQLGAPDPGLRTDARRRLTALGEKILPYLRALPPATDPEIARGLRGLMRRFQSVRLELDPPAGAHRIGRPLVLRAHLVNDTEDAISLPFVQRRNQGFGALSALELRVGGRYRLSLKPDQVEVDNEGRDPRVLQPGETVHFTITLGPSQNPLRAPGRREVAVALTARPLRRLPGGGDARRNSPDVVVTSAYLETRAVTVTSVGRGAEQLETALASGDPETRAGAVMELSAREDAAVLDVLRAHAGDHDLRLVAIRRLGAAADPRDLERIRVAAKDPSLEVRRTALAALGHYGRDRHARSVLVAATQDPETREVAVRALAHHRHPVTIDCFVRMLQQARTRSAWMRHAVNAIYDWTGMVVTHEGPEIDAFERWWLKNRGRWTRENLPRGDPHR
jgi:HEAT repeat protein